MKQLIIIEPRCSTEATRERLSYVAEMTGAVVLPYGCEVPGEEPRGVYRDSEERYRNDPAFHAAVTTMERMATQHGFTPGELKQIAFKAALNIETERLPKVIVHLDTKGGG